MRRRVAVLCLCVMALGSVSLAAAETEAVYPELAPLETDAALLMLSGPTGYGVTENPRALPAASGSDPLYGVEADVDCIKVYTRENRGEQLRSEYVFARDGERFALSRLTTLRWDEASGSAERERFDFASADTSVAPGTVRADTFSAAGDVERFAFESQAYATTLDPGSVRRTGGARPGAGGRRAFGGAGGSARGKRRRSTSGAAGRSPLQRRCAGHAYVRGLRRAISGGRGIPKPHLRTPGARDGRPVRSMRRSV